MGGKGKTPFSREFGAALCTISEALSISSSQDAHIVSLLSHQNDYKCYLRFSSRTTIYMFVLHIKLTTDSICVRKLKYKISQETQTQDGGKYPVHNAMSVTADK